MKKIIYLTLLCLITSLFSSNTTIFAAASGTCGKNLTYSYNDGTLSINGSGNMENYNLNDSPWNSYRDDIKSVKIDNNVTSIGDSAFSHCSNLENLTLGNNLKIIGEDAFSYCNKLGNITIPNSVETISDYAFYDCDGFTDVIIPNSVKTIGQASFFSCSNLKNITIPNSVTSMGLHPFASCSQLSNIEVSKDNQFFSSDEYGALYNKNKTELIHYPIGNKRKEYIIPDTVEIIKDQAFLIGNNLTSITIPNSLKTVEKSAFFYCSSIETVNFNGSNKDWNNISIESQNDCLKNAARNYFWYVTIKDENGNEINKKKYNLDSLIDISDIETRYMQNITLYTDLTMKNIFDTSTAINNNLTLYVNLENSLPKETQTTVSTLFTVKPKNIIKGSIIILTLYNGNTFVEIQSKPYDGESIIFITDKVYTNAKVMVWSNLSNIMPLCNAEIVK